MNIKNAWIVFAVALLITLPTRIYQILFLMDQDTGFYIDGMKTTAFVSAGLAAGVLLLVLMCFLDKGKKPKYSPIRSLPAAVFGTLAGLGILLQYAVGIFTSAESENPVPSVLLALIGICAGGVIILTSYQFATGGNTFEHHPLLALLPSVWGCASLVSLFINYVAVVNVSENIYDTFAVIFLLLFLFAQAKMFARIEDEKSGKMVYIFGLPAALLLLATGIPGTLMVLFNLHSAGTFPVGLYPVNVLLALYVVLFLIQYAKIGEDKPRPDDELSAEEPRVSAAVSETADNAGDDPADSVLKEESCLEFLAKAYHSQEQFCERMKSPFLRN